VQIVKGAFCFLDLGKKSIADQNIHIFEETRELRHCEDRGPSPHGQKQETISTIRGGKAAGKKKKGGRICRCVERGRQCRALLGGKDSV